jgi:hypothetical protein
LFDKEFVGKEIIDKEFVGKEFVDKKFVVKEFRRQGNQRQLDESGICCG